MRVVTFQSRDILMEILNNGKCETLQSLHDSYSPNLFNDNSDSVWIKVNANTTKYYLDSNGVLNLTWKNDFKNTQKNKVYPFYAYRKHNYCGYMYNMSVMLIYRLAAHFMGAMNFFNRDIIELEVPEGEILETRVTSNYNECLLPYIKEEWLVSVLSYEDCIVECAYGENALLYNNTVYRDDTYRMCYSKDIVLSGHGYGDDLYKCMSPEIIKGITDSTIQRDYVQPDVWTAFKVYCYMLRHNLTISDLHSVNKRVATVEMPLEFDKSLIDAFNECKSEVFKAIDKYPMEVIEHYYDRLTDYRK